MLCRSATSAYTLLGAVAEILTSGGVGAGTNAGVATTSAPVVTIAAPAVR